MTGNGTELSNCRNVVGIPAENHFSVCEQVSISSIFSYKSALYGFFRVIVCLCNFLVHEYQHKSSLKNVDYIFQFH